MLMFYTIPQNPIQFALIFGEWVGVVWIGIQVEKFTPWYISLPLFVMFSGAWLILWDMFASLYVTNAFDFLSRGF